MLFVPLYKKQKSACHPRVVWMVLVVDGSTAALTILERPGNASHEHAGTTTTVSEGIWGHRLLPLSIGNVHRFCEFWNCLQIKGTKHILRFLIL
jgi:hypothetical protein